MIYFLIYLIGLCIVTAAFFVINQQTKWLTQKNYDEHVLEFASAIVFWPLFLVVFIVLSIITGIIGGVEKYIVPKE